MAAVFSESPELFTHEEKIEKLLSSLGLNQLSDEERVKPGICTLDDAATKIFDMTRQVTSNDIRDLEALDPYKILEIADEALYYQLPPERILVLLESGLNEKMPLYVRAKSAIKAASAHKRFDENHSDIITSLYKLAVGLGEENERDPEMLECQKTARLFLQGHLWNTGRYRECIEVCNAQLACVQRHPEQHWAGSVRGDALEEKINSLARLGQLDEAFKVLHEARTSDVSDGYRTKFLSKEFEERLRRYAFRGLTR